MPMGMHNPLPASMRSECKKAGKILESFTNPSFTGSPAREIPQRVLANAQGLVIFTVTKAGFLGSVRFGSGVLVARLPNGSWSAPSAIATLGGGFGGQVGFELTDFVFILNDRKAVRTFAQSGSLTLGGNLSIAFGPLGRSAEVAGGASKEGVASMFAYSKTKGLFGGVSLEGNMLVERKSANKKLYQQEVRASQLLDGEIPPPPEAEALLRVLNSEAFQPRPSRPPLGLPSSSTPVEMPATAQHQPPAEMPAEVPAGGAPNRTDLHSSANELHGDSLPTPELPGESRPVSEHPVSEHPLSEHTVSERPVSELPAELPAHLDPASQDPPADAKMSPVSPMSPLPPVSSAPPVATSSNNVAQ